MCETALKLVAIEDSMRGIFKGFGDLHAMSFDEQAEFGNLMLHLQRLRLRHNERCAFCEAEKVSESLDRVRA